MACDDRYLYTSPWFYLFIFTIILFIMFIIIIENDGGFKSGTGIPTWIWMMFLFIILFLFVSFVLYYYHIKNIPCDVVSVNPIMPITPIQAPVYQQINIPVYAEVTPCSVPTINLVEEEVIYEEDTTIYRYTDADVVIPFSALNPFV